MSGITRLVVSFVLAAAPLRAETADCFNTLVAIGNSITYHAPAPSIGWPGNWGMAASASGRDYVAQLARVIGAQYGGSPVRAIRANPNQLERQEVARTVLDTLGRVSRPASLVIIELGDNVPSGSEPTANFIRRYEALLDRVRPPSGLLVCLGAWWASARLDPAMRNACASANGAFVELNGLAASPEYSARSSSLRASQGVLAHPGDKGMAGIAGLIMERIGARLPRIACARGAQAASVAATPGEPVQP